MPTKESTRPPTYPNSHSAYLLSIVIPCFNAMPFIQETMKSILSFPSNEVEIVVQDGGSTDGTLQFLEQLGTSISLESKDDNGQTDALNTGIRRSSGKYIGWLNADDLYTPELWREAYEIMRQPEGPDAIYGDYTIIFANGDPMRKMILSDLDWAKFLVEGRPVWSGATIWHRRVFQQFGYFDESLHYCMDAEFFLRVGGLIKTQHVPFEFGRFRIHETSKTGSKPWEFFRESHRVRWSYAQNSVSHKSWVLLGDAKQAIYYLTKPLRESRLYSKLRPSHSYGHT